MFHLISAGGFLSRKSVEVDLIGNKKFMLSPELASQAGLPIKIMAGLDDSLGKKEKPRSLQAVDIHHNHNESSKKKQSWSNGYVYVELHQIGPFSFLFARGCIYARRKSVNSIVNDPKTTACCIVVSTTWHAGC
ncbi:hypothetical protein [Candidatus Villigracilis saccharophilus]|uniref:hypothetical protein n=1 Tax=Candidatus Villigracilis saccharophilus TaxID=3140684 RepID=UPI003134D526|nr:hypothetical protein [Anaerolineales bacterium]